MSGDLLEPEVGDALPEREVEWIASRLREFNETVTPVDYRPLSVVIRNDAGQIIGGLTGKTFWNYLFVIILWVDENHRGSGIGSRLLEAAEQEAVTRGCGYVQLDTYSFQALPFYQRLGYEEFGRIDGFAGGHERSYLRKVLRPGN
tara:strand:- start:6225 stop:6662 length:438 start_codon:yes stop_codon:yes gene_type:complete